MTRTKYVTLQVEGAPWTMRRVRVFPREKPLVDRRGGLNIGLAKIEGHLASPWTGKSRTHLPKLLDFIRDSRAFVEENEKRLQDPQRTPR